MKTIIYNTKDIPAGKDNDFWVHFIFADVSGWIGVQREDDDEEKDSPIELTTQIMAQMVMESTMFEDEKETEISGFTYYHNNINQMEIVEAVPCSGEPTVFIWEYM